MKIELWFDIVSPYSYLAYKVLERYRPRWGFELEMKPAFLGGIMQATGNTPPIMLAARAPWLVDDIVRNGKFFDVEVKIPDGFPHPTITAMRMLIQLSDAQDARCELVAASMWQRYWGQGQDINDPAVLLGAAADAGLEQGEAQQLLEKTRDEAVKALLKKATDQALEVGSFGMPMIILEREGERSFTFGSDRFERLAFEQGLSWDGPVPDRE